MKRIVWIDRTRGLAILLVILGHIIGGIDIEKLNGAENFYKIIYSFHMPLVFAVSGAVSNEERIQTIKGTKECFRYLGKCFVNLYGTYLIFAYLFWAVKFFIYQGHEIVTLSDAMRIPFEYKAWTPGWYLLALLVIKYLDFIVVRYIKNSKVRNIIWILLFILGSYFPFAFVADGCRNILYFQLGRRWKKEKFESPEIIFVMLVIAGVFKCEGIMEVLSDFVIAASLCEIVIMVMTKFQNKNMKIFEKIGRNSMVPYVLHAYFTIPVRIILHKMNCTSFSLFVLLEFAVAILLTYISIYFVEKHSFIRRIFYPIH